MRSNSLRFVAGLRLVAGLAVTAVVFGAFAHQAEAKRGRRYDPKLARRPLVMTSFVQNGRTDVRRNEKLTFKFSTYVRRGSVSHRSLRIAASGPTGFRDATGALRARGVKVTFDPTRSQRNFDDSKKKNSLVTEKDNPTGFGAFTDHKVVIPAPPELEVLKDLRRRRILQTFSGSFRTNADYDDPVPGQPSFVGDAGTGQLGFVPRQGGATGLVDEDAQIVLEFSEPIDIATLDPSSSVIVKRITIGERVPGFIKLDPNEPTGRRFLFVPSLGFGSDEANVAGWDIEVTLSTEITDLAGNPLKRPKVFPIFRTKYVPGKPSSSILGESFEDQVQMDAISVLEGGEWNTTEAGFLIGGVPTTYPNVDVQYTQASTGVTALVRTRVVEPLVAESVPSTGGGGCTAVPKGSRTQMLYIPADVGIAAAVTAVGWGPSSNALFAATHPEVEVRMGHTSVQALGSDWDANVNLGTPQLLYEGEYSIPQALNINPPGLAGGFWDWPVFASPFEFNGINNVVFDAKVAGGNNCQILRIAFIPAGVSFPIRRAVSRDKDQPSASFATDAVVYDIRFKKRRRTTRATSLFYELASDFPILAAPIVSPSTQVGGVQVVFELEGAPGKPDPFNPGGFVADPSRGTGWVTDPSLADGFRFVRFRITMVANLTTNQTARISSVQVPYQF